MVLLFTHEDMVQSVNMKEAILALEEAHRQFAVGKVSMPSRMSVQSPEGRMMVMPATVHGTRYMGLKVFTVFEKVRFLLLLFDSKDGSLLAAMDADYLGQLRTGAVSALATKFMCREKSITVGVIGSGVQARTQLEGICVIRNVERAKVFSPNPEHRRQYARDMSRILGITVHAVESIEEVVRGSDVLVTATSAQEPVVNGKWLEDGTHINAIGSTRPTLRELDDETIRRSSLIIADSKEQALNESGDLIMPVKSGLLTSDRIFELWELVVGRASRKSERDIALFKSVGTALQDVAVAAKAYESAKSKGIGRDLGEILISRRAAAR